MSNRCLCPGLLALVALALSPHVYAQANVDLNTWSEITPNSNGFWDVDNNGVEGSGPNGDFVRQEVNNAVTIFLSPDSFINTEINGSFEVQTTSDNDFIGFVFGYQNPGSNAIDALLLDWKQGAQAGASEGFRLSYVTGEISTQDGISSPFWLHNSNNDVTFQSLGTNFSSTNGWQDNTEYDFTLDYSTSNITINIAGGQFGDGGSEIFNVDAGDVPAIFPGGEFPDGQFGFYNLSQTNVSYESFTRTDDPVLATDPSDNGALGFGSVRVGDNTTVTLEVTNAGGPGSTLTGTAPTPTDPVFSLDSAPDSFTLDEGESTSFDYTFTPDARGVFSEVVNVSSNDPVDTDGHDITLAGNAVAPVFFEPGDSGFGDVDPNTPSSIFINLANATPDGDQGGLTDLTLNDITVGGDDAAFFSLIGFTPGQTIAGGSGYLLEVQFTGDGSVDLFEAFLLLETDQGVALGGDGDDFQINLSANAVPEPGSLALLGLGAFVLIRRRG